MSVAFCLTNSRVSSLCTETGQHQTPACSNSSTGHGNLPGRFHFNRKEYSMSTQVVQVLSSQELFPVCLVSRRQVLQISLHMIRVPLHVYRKPQRGTFTGNSNNEYRSRRRHRCRLSKNTRTLHCPQRWTRNRLRPRSE